jgi:hypothetical protein
VPAVQFDLFDKPHLEGLGQADGIITPSEERALIASIDGVELLPFRFQGWLGKRLTASYGWRYDFDTGSFGPADPIPDWLLPLREKAARFAHLTSDELVQALVIRLRCEVRRPAGSRHARANGTSSAISDGGSVASPRAPGPMGRLGHGARRAASDSDTNASFRAESQSFLSTKAVIPWYEFLSRTSTLRKTKVRWTDRVATRILLE